MDIQMKYTMTILLLGLMAVGCIGNGDGCDPGAVQCYEDIIEMCDEDGYWVETMDCMGDYGQRCETDGCGYWYCGEKGTVSTCQSFD
jgi:hypothetical protein